MSGKQRREMVERDHPALSTVRQCTLLGISRSSRRTVKYEEVYLKAYSNGREAKAGIDAYFRFYNTQRPHQALSYRTPAEVFYGNEMQSTERATERRWSLSRSLESYTGALGPSLNLVSILSN